MEFIQYIAVFLGVLLASLVGGASIISTVIGALAGLACYLLAWEKINTSRTVDGFWLRYRANFLNLLVVILCIIALNMFSTDWWAMPLGIVIGSFVGEAIAEKFGWSGSALESQSIFMNSYIIAMVSAAVADGEFSKKERILVETTAKNLFASLGYGHESDIKPIIEEAFADPPNASQVGGFVRELDEEYKQ